MCPKIDVMERECKKLEFEGDLNKAQLRLSPTLTLNRSLPYIYIYRRFCSLYAPAAFSK
jgi:hypothetical protein